MIVDAASAPVSGESGLHTLHLSEAGGLTQFGAYVDTLAPGAWSSNRHWHSAEDELAFVLEGTVTLRDDFGMTDLAPGDAVAWPHGNRNAHHLTNRGTGPCRYLIVGTRAARDVCTYPDSGNRQVNGDADWRLLDASGNVLRGGELPPELRGLPPAWGTPYPGEPRRHLLRTEGRSWVDEAPSDHPVLGGGLGPYRHSVLGEPGGLSQIGVHLECLPPGSRSSHRHWHEAEDEAVLMLEGSLTLVEDAELTLGPGAMACWPAGRAVGHRLENRGAAGATYLVLGTRLAADRVHYPDAGISMTITGRRDRIFTDAAGRVVHRSGGGA